MISEAFKDCNFESNKIYDEVIKPISKLSAPLFKDIILKELTIEQFTNFYHVFQMFKTNPQLNSLVDLPSLNESIIEYVKEVK